MGIDDLAHRHVVIDGGDKIGDVFGHIHLVEPLALEQLGRAVGQIGAQYAGDDAFLICLVKGGQTIVKMA